MRHTYRSLAAASASCSVIINESLADCRAAVDFEHMFSGTARTFTERVAAKQVEVDVVSHADAVSLLRRANVLVVMDRPIGQLPASVRPILALSNLAYGTEREALTCRNWSRIWVPSDFLRESVIELAPWLADKVDIVPPVVTAGSTRATPGLRQARVRLTARGAQRGQTLLFPHRADPGKGLVEMIGLLERLKASDERWQLVVTEPSGGDDAANQRFFRHVMAEATARGLEPNLVTVPWLSREEMPGLYAMAGATMVASSLPESFGLVAAESVVAGTPVVARPVGALSFEHTSGGVHFVSDFVTTNSVSLVTRLVRQRVDAAVREQVAARFSYARHDDAVRQSLRTPER
jgi:glycosyltransferase involved in cell wall biosynthesis